MERREFILAATAASLPAACDPTTTPATGEAPPVGEPRRVAARTRGATHGPITRLVSPGDLGEELKPFVFLDHFEISAPGVEGERAASRTPQAGRGDRVSGSPPDGGETRSGSPVSFGWHPHSGIATVTYIFEGTGTYEETNGSRGVLPTGSIEWMRASGGVWHTGGANAPIRGFQLWVALPPELENAESESAYIEPARIPVLGPARLLLGRWGDLESPVPSPEGMTYLAVTLRAGERWSFDPPAGQTLAWLAVHRGTLAVSGAAAGQERVGKPEIVVFERGERPIVIEATEDTDLVVGAAVPHPHALVTGRYSVHTSRDALRLGESNIARIGHDLRAAGLISG
jgi:redox-sensitive bicupin YhaK (pirin superfamily)